MAVVNGRMVKVEERKFRIKSIYITSQVTIRLMPMRVVLDSNRWLASMDRRCLSRFGSNAICARNTNA